jgi:hypothetical protein
MLEVFDYSVGLSTILLAIMDRLDLNRSAVVVMSLCC